MNTKPKLKVELTRLDKVFNISNIILLTVLWVIVLCSYKKLPETIAVHFDTVGNANGYGSKDSLLILPLIATITFIGLSALNRYPHLFNYPVTITEGNAQWQYLLATRMIRMINTGLLLSFVTISYLLSSPQPRATVGIWLLPAIVIVTTLPVVYYFIQSKRAS